MADSIGLAYGRTQQALGQSTTRLSSGLRINTAADDPSGLAIATSLQSQAQGLDAGSQDIQTASNALSVADGALSTVQSILQRVRALIVEGRSGLLSDDDRANLNDEIRSLAVEIDRTAENTQFNGLKLLDGSFAGGSAGTPGGPVIPQNDTLSSTLSLVDPTSVFSSPNGVALNLKITVDSYDPATDLLNVTFDVQSPDPSVTYNETFPQTKQILAGQNYDNDPWNTLGLPIPPNVALREIDDANGNPLLDYQLNDLSADDVGKSAFIYTQDPQPATTSGPMHVETGDHEGNVLGVTLPGVSRSDLSLSTAAVYASDTLTEGSEYRVDDAISAINAARAQVGAQTVALQETTTDAQTASVNLTASESAIRDLNVAAETTNLTRQQILAQTQTYLLHDAQSSAQQIATLLSDSILSSP